MKKLGCIFIFVLTTLLDPTLQGPVRAPTNDDDVTEACVTLGPFLGSLEETLDEMNKDQCAEVEIKDQCLNPTVALLKKSCIKEGGKHLVKKCVVEPYQVCRDALMSRKSSFYQDSIF